MLSIVLTALLAAVPLVDAIKSGDRTAALALLQQKANVNAAEPDGTTALHWAVEREDPEPRQALGQLLNRQVGE